MTENELDEKSYALPGANNMECQNDVTSESNEIPMENNSADTFFSPNDTSDDHPEEKDEEVEEVPAKVETVQQIEEIFVPASSELRHGYRILKELMADSNKSVNWPFMDAVDSEACGLYDYYERIKQPMWLRKVKEKFESTEYETITQFVADFRLMLENCYRYNGPDHYVSKRGQRLETMLEQKLALLSRELRERTSIAATSGKPEDQGLSPYGSSLRRRGKNIAPHDSSALLNQLRHEEALKEREWRKQQIQERRAAQEAIAQEVLDWEDNLLEEPVKTQLKHMWELPQIGLFLFLCQEPLNIGEVAQYELERCFAMTKESTTLQAVMTSLLSTPYQRTRLDKKPMMPYKVWEDKLRIRLNQWYKVLAECDQDCDKAGTKLGLDPYLFIVIGKKNPLLKKKFHELSYYRKIWIVKALCDFCLATQESIRDAMECQPIEEQREYLLGYDGEGNTYMHFPQFCGADLRVYKQAPFPHPKMEPIQAPETPPPPVTPGKRKHNQSSKSSIKKKKRREGKEKAAIAPVTTRRPSRLRQHIKTVLPIEQLQDSSSESESASEAEVSSMSVDESSTCSSSYTGSSSRFRTRNPRRLNGSMSSKDNTPEPPSFRGKIRKPRDYDSKLRCHSPLSKANLDDGRHSSKDVTPEPTPARKICKSLQLESEASCDSPLTWTQKKTLSQLMRVKSESANCDSDTPKHNLSTQNMDNDITEDCTKGDNSSLSKHVDSKCNNSGNTNNKVDVVPSDHNDSQGNCDKLKSTCEAQTSNEGSIDNNKVKNKDHVAQSENDSKQVNCERDRTSDSSPNVTDSHSKSDHMDTTENSIDGQPDMAPNSDGKINMEDVKTADICHHKSGVISVDDCKADSTDYHNSEMQSDIKSSINCKDEEKSMKNEDTNCISEGNLKTCKSEMDDGLSDSKSNLKSLVTENCVKSVVKSEDSKDTCSLSLLANMAVANMSVQSAENMDVKLECKPELHVSDIKRMVTDEESLSLAQVDKEGEGNIACVKMESQNGGIQNGQGETTPTENKESPDDVIKEQKTGNEDEEKSNKQKTVTEEPEEEPEEEEEEEEEVTPEIGPFSLIADTVDSLRQLTELFAEPEPAVQTSRSKRGKTPKPPVRKRCVAELYNRLLYLLKELEPWESKLVQATKRARTKLRKEKQDYQDEEEKGDVEDVWESEESASEDENSSSGEDQEENSNAQAQEKTDKKSKKGVQEIETSSSGRNTPLEEDLSMSSRGRLRKRRIIPNNSEEAPKKRKVVKNLDDNYSSASHVPNILQRHHTVKTENTLIRTIPMSLLDQLKLPALNADLKTQTIPSYMSASQMLLRANLTSKQTLISSSLSTNTTADKTGLSADVVKQMIGAVPKSGASHPVIQQLLAQKAPVVFTEGGKPYGVQVIPSSTTKQTGQNPAVILSTNSAPKVPSSTATSNANPVAQIQLAGNKSRKIEIAKPRTTAIQLTVSNPGKIAIPAGKVQHYNQNVLSTLPPAVIQQLLKNQSLRIQTVSTDKAGSGVPLARAIFLSQPGKEGAHTLTMSNAVSAPQAAQPVNLPITVANQQMQKGVVSAKPLMPQAIASCSAVAAVNTAQPQDNSQKTKVPTSPNKPKYACHVTVKSLLQDRAKKALELGAETPKEDVEDGTTEAFVPSAAQVLSLASEVGQQLPGILEMSKSDSHAQPIVVTVNTAIRGLPQTLKLPSKETLDSAVQAVVTSVKTTLPTAHLKVPAPSTMPSIQHRKNVTRTIQSMKAPIPVVNASSSVSLSSTTTGGSFMAGHLSQQKNAGVILTNRAGMPAVSQVPITTLTASTGISNQPMIPASKPVNPTGNIMTQPQVVKNNISVQQNSTLLKVTPQTFMTSQGLVQGFLTPQGLVIPQTALQQGFPASGKQILVGNPQMLQNKVVAPGNGSNKVASVNQNSQMPGKVVKPTMQLSTGGNPQGSVTTLPSVVPVNKALTTIGQSVVTSRPGSLSSSSSSKLLLQAVNTVMPKGMLPASSASSLCMKASIHASSPETIASQNSLMSGMNIKIESKDTKMSGDQVLKPASNISKPMSPEILHVNHKGDGKQTMVVGVPSTHPGKVGVPMFDPSTLKSTSTVSLSVSQGLSAKATVSSPSSVTPGKISEGSLPAAQVLLSLSQGLQNAKTVSPRKDVPLPVDAVLKNKGAGNLSENNTQSITQPSLLNIAGQTGSSQKLLLLNIGGNLYTSQGIPVTLENGVLKIAGSVPSQDAKVQQVIGFNTTSQTPVLQDVRQPIMTVAQQQTVQPSSGVQDMGSNKQQIVQFATKPTVVHSQPGVSAAGLVARQPGSFPMQQVLVSAVGSKKTVAAPQTNAVNNGPVVVKQILTSPTRLIQPTPLPQSQAVNISPNRLLTIPSQGNQPIQLVGVNTQHQAITNKGQIIQVMVPQSLTGGTAVIGNVVAKDTLLQKPVVIGPGGTTVNQHGFTIAASPNKHVPTNQIKSALIVSPKTVSGQRLLSPQKISPKAPVAGIQLVGSTQPGQNSPVVFQMVTPSSNSAQTALPWKPGMSPVISSTVINAKPVRQTVVVQQNELSVNSVNSAGKGQIQPVRLPAPPNTAPNTVPVTANIANQHLMPDMSKGKPS